MDMNVKRTFQPGSVVAEKFEIKEYLGEGSLEDDVYIGKQTDLDRDVTIRIMPQSLSNDQEMVKRFQQEIKMTASLRHANILPTYESGKYTGRLYFVTGYEKGKYLNDYIKKNGVIDEKDALRHITHLTDALKYAWESAKILHRNVKPSTILITNRGEAILEDFGMAKSYAGGEGGMDLTMAGVTIGNPQYMSPEQVRGQTDLDFRVDSYCLGLVLYEMLTGTPVFDYKSPVQLMEAHLKEDPVPIEDTNPNVGQVTLNIVKKMLAKDRGERHLTWEDLLNDLKAAEEGKSLDEKIVEVTEEPKKEKLKLKTQDRDFTRIESKDKEVSIIEPTAKKIPIKYILIGLGILIFVGFIVWALI